MLRKYSKPKVDFSKVRKSHIIPDQAMSVQEIVRRFVRGVPVDLKQWPDVFVDQASHDLEKMSRMNFADKIEFSKEMQARASEVQRQLESDEFQRVSERRAAKKKKQDAPKKQHSSTLDNTMLDDTRTTGPGGKEVLRS